MNNLPHHIIRSGHAAQISATGAASATVAPENSPHAPFRRASTHPLRPSRKTPATPLMLNPTAAWRTLCARTGGGIALGTFYRWIRDGRVVSIRMGRKILVPVVMVDQLIEQCLNGEELL